MAFDREQHVAEAAERMGADRFALVGAANLAHVALVGRHAEMVRPEPHQPLPEADLGAERRVDARLGLAQIDLLRRARIGIGIGIGPGGLLRWRRRRVGRPGVRAGRHGVGWGRVGLLRGALGLPCRPARLLKDERRARRRPTGGQIGIGDEPGAGAIQFGKQCATRIRGDRRHRSGARAEPETMQCQCGLGLRIKGHAPCPFDRDARRYPQRRIVGDRHVKIAARSLAPT